ncbi:unnamed protein product, partial [Urochloa humidicola]
VHLLLFRSSLALHHDWRRRRPDLPLHPRSMSPTQKPWPAATLLPPPSSSLPDEPAAPHVDRLDVVYLIFFTWAWGSCRRSAGPRVGGHTCLPRVKADPAAAIGKIRCVVSASSAAGAAVDFNDAGVQEGDQIWHRLAGGRNGKM